MAAKAFEQGQQLHLSNEMGEPVPRLCIQNAMIQHHPEF
jgi:hypothetical protein